MVIFEYCPFGNLQKFLIKHRSEFIDQIVRGEDTIDPTITTKYIMQQRNHLYSAFNRLFIFYSSKFESIFKIKCKCSFP